MEENLNVQSNPTDSRPRRSRMSIKRALVFVLFILMIGGLIALGMFSVQQRNKIGDRNGEITTLREKIGALESSGASSPKSTESTGDDTASCTGGTNYTAEIGRFRIELNSPQIIIRKIDGGFEGGPVTSLQIGSCVTGETNVVDVFPTNELNVLAHPSSTSAELKTQYESRTGSSLTAAGTVAIAGETAQKYASDGLFSTTLIYFDHGGIGYEIELVDTNTVTNGILSDLMADWSFTP
jgi:hypothetical protein